MNLNNESGNIAKSGAKVAIFICNSNGAITYYEYGILYHIKAAFLAGLQYY
jgi:hypothetical protein